MEKEIFLWMVKHLKPYKWRLFTLLVSSLVLAGVEVLSPILIQSIVDAALQKTFDVTKVTVYFFVLLVNALPLVGIQRNKLGEILAYDLRESAFEKLLYKDISFYEEKGSAAIVSQLKKAASASGIIINILCHGQLLISVPVAIFSLYYIARVDVYVSMSLFFFVLVFLLVGSYLGKIIKKNNEAYEEIDDNLTQRQSEAIEQISTIKTHSAEHAELSHFKAERIRSFGLFSKFINSAALMWFLGAGGSSFAQVIAIVFFLPRLTDGSITVGSFFALLMFSSRVVRPSLYLGDYYVRLKESEAKMKPVIEMLRSDGEILEKNIRDIGELKDGITINDVSFSYPSKLDEVLDGLTLWIPAKKKTAIVGLSGSGKTTLSRLLVRLYKPSNGTIEYDGVDLNQFTSDSLYQRFAYLAQEVPIFSGTIKENVGLGVEDPADEEVMSALERASANFVEDISGGIHAKVGEKGRKLSGGERQRIAIARTLMRKPSVIILDEATSSLDNKTEAEVHDTFEELKKMNGGITMVVIAHRLSTVLNSDQIVVLDHGKVKAIGTHEELMNACPLYQELNNTFA